MQHVNTIDIKHQTTTSYETEKKRLEPTSRSQGVLAIDNSTCKVVLVVDGRGSFSSVVAVPVLLPTKPFVPRDARC